MVLSWGREFPIKLTDSQYHVTWKSIHVWGNKRNLWFNICWKVKGSLTYSQKLYLHIYTRLLSEIKGSAVLTICRWVYCLCWLCKKLYLLNDSLGEEFLKTISNLWTHQLNSLYVLDRVFFVAILKVCKKFNKSICLDLICCINV